MLPVVLIHDFTFFLLSYLSRCETSSFLLCFNFLKKDIAKNFCTPCPCDTGGDTCIRPAHPRVFSPREHTRTRKPALFSLLLLPTIFTYSRVSPPLDSPSSSPATASPSVLPSAITSCRSKLEFGPSSPHHQSGKYSGIKSLPDPEACYLRCPSANYCRTDYILPPFLSSFALS